MIDRIKQLLNQKLDFLSDKPNKPKPLPENHTVLDIEKHQKALALYHSKMDAWYNENQQILDNNSIINNQIVNEIETECYNGYNFSENQKKLILSLIYTSDLIEFYKKMVEFVPIAYLLINDIDPSK